MSDWRLLRSHRAVKPDKKTAAKSRHESLVPPSNEKAIKDVFGITRTPVAKASDKAGSL